MSLMKGQPPFDTQLVILALCVRNGEKRPLAIVQIGFPLCCYLILLCFMQLSALGYKGLILRLCPVGDWVLLWAWPWL